MLKCCSECGRPMTDWPDPESLPIANLQRRILTAIIDKNGRFISKDAIVDRIYGEYASGGPLCAYNVVESHISKMRHIVRAAGFAIEGKRFEGYRIVKLDTSGRQNSNSQAGGPQGDTSSPRMAGRRSSGAGFAGQPPAGGDAAVRREERT